jgi:hypothetical protein
LIPEPAIEVSVPAAAGFVPLLRKAAASSCPPRLASRVDDVRLAVSEACTLLLQLHAPATSLVLGVTVEDDRMTLFIRSDAAASDVPPSGLEESWSWRLLVTTADQVTFRPSPQGPSVELTFVAVKPLTGGDVPEP